MKNKLLNTALLYAIAGFAQAQSLCFTPAVNYGVGTNPRSVASADFNGDGKIDLAVANSNSNNVSVLLGDGVGSFAAAVNFMVGSNPYSVTAADFNGDGKIDLATANSIDNNVSVLLGNGDGTFVANVDYTVGTRPRSVASADFNGDGKIDLAVANSNSNDVSLLLGNGTGSFAAAVNFTVGSNPFSVTAADFNGDGKMDLATANTNSNDVSVLLGNGTGSFAAAVNFAVGLSPYSVTTADFNGDGKSDLATANHVNDNVSVLIGNGAGSFAAAANFTVGPNPLSVTAADFNGDGKSDLATANQGDDNVLVLLGNGAGSFATAANFTVGLGPYFVTAADFNGDGKSDLATANFTSGNASILLNCLNPGAALNFDGVNNYIALPVNPVSGDFTIEYWVKTTQTGGGPQWYGGIGIVDAEYPGVTNDFGTALVGNKFAFGIGNPDATIVSTTSINDGNWHHVAGTWIMSTGAMSLYVDGALESTGVGSTNPRNAPARITIGAMQTLFTYFDGEIDEVRIWNNARTQCEINTYKNCEIPANATGLVANYHFNQGNAGANNAGLNSLTDATSNTMTGTLTNFALNGTTSNWVAPGAVVSGYTTPAPTPTVTINSGVICAGQSFTMMPGGADSYTYSGGTDVVTPSADASYTVTGIDANGCSNTAVSSVTVNSAPIITSQSGNATLCGDVSSTHSVSVAGTNTYEWYYTQIGGPDEAMIDGSYTEINYTTNVMTIQQVLTGNYNGYGIYCVITNSNNCSTTSMIDTIVANPLPTILVNSGAICSGQSFTIVPDCAGTYSYSGGTNIVMPSADASYTVTVLDANGCSNTAVSSVTVNALPNLMAATNNTLLCTGQTATLSVSGASTYTWSTAENTIDIAVSPTVQTTYTVAGTDANGCSNTTTITQDVSICTGIASLSENLSITIYPNPNNGLFVTELTTKAKVIVTNALGQLVSAETLEAGKHNIDIHNEATGVYFVKVIENNGQQTIKVIKE